MSWLERLQQPDEVRPVLNKLLIVRGMVGLP